MVISKSDYMLFLKHPAWIWVKKHDPKKIPPVDENIQAMFDAGHQFEPYAESLFPEGVSLSFEDYDEYLTLPERTIDAINSGAKVIFQPRFVWQDFTCISDIVCFVGDKEVDLYEIKASTKVKLEHEFDLAFQHYHDIASSARTMGLAPNVRYTLPNTSHACDSQKLAHKNLLF